MGKLTDRHCRNLTAPGKYADGHGLYLHVTGKGRYWRAAYRFDGKQKTASFGVYPRVSLKDELRTMRWEELDLNAALWTKPAHTMKKRRVHLIPLPRQALALIEALRIHTGHLPAPCVCQPDHGQAHQQRRSAAAKGAQRPARKNHGSVLGVVYNWI